MTGFPHGGQGRITALLKKEKVDYKRMTVKQVYNMKGDFEKLQVKRSGNSIKALDIEAMYPSVLFIQVKRAVDFFLLDGSQEEKDTARSCLEMIRFSMANTMITFNGKYWQYGGSDVDKKGLTIKGFESAFLADLVAAFILENSQDLFEDSIYSKMYHNNGIKVDLRIQTTDKIL